MTKLSELFLGPLPLREHNGVLFEYVAPLGESGAFTVTGDDCLIAPKGSTFNNTSNGVISTDGFIHFDSTFKLFQINDNHIAAKSSSVRLYEWIVRCNASPGANLQGAMFFNRVDNSNYWLATLRYNAGQHTLEIYDVTAGSSTSRGNVTFAPDDPTLMKVQIFDAGDTVIAQVAGFETDADTDHAASTVRYNVASRPHKAGTGCGFGSWDGSDEYAFRSLRVIEV